MVEALTPVIFEGGTELLVVWEYFFYLGPEKCGVVHLLSVTQLVDYHVVYDFGSGVHQCTVEIQVTGGAAASPAGLLMPDGDPSVSVLHVKAYISEPVLTVPLYRHLSGQCLDFFRLTYWKFFSA